jgi:hypothetical protein
LSRILQNTQNLEKIERLNSNSKKSTQNLEELGFRIYLKPIGENVDLKNHIFGGGFEFGGFNLPRSRFLIQNPKREKRNHVRERNRINELKRARW